jgi:hypothetical protein
MRDFKIIVPADCVASEDRAENDHALRQMQTVLHAEITPSGEIDVSTLNRRSARDAQAAG